MNEYQTLLPLHMYLYLHSLHSLLIKAQKQPKQVQICHLEKSSNADLLNICVLF